ncbi:flavin reductase family protein [Klugiella xanthotipulae]|uniref:Flavin reductase (DIM6/NTAB) family NADH-FMN oxidoreductase RutF n=1 Tax=Klugiella xanthotipulae TaxID=244735 RepID=A0A543HSW6_9MICO|nr:flavin reductase family protein [Klugiella xanthotipulae]TQM61423.1 flavin reductase (DIM6/NTAB) family NADH-FMN oxidoreductase RutF [Klugiella xanthotipulae]
MNTQLPATVTDERSQTAFRQAFQRHSAGVAIVTAADITGRPTGFTATSLASLSAQPPMLTFNLATSSSSWEALTETNHVAVHMLGVRNRALAARMAGPRANRFVGDHWHRGEFNLPILNDVTAVLIGTIIQRNVVHGAACIVAKVVGGYQGEDDAGLLYRERVYLAPQPLTD